MKTISRGGSLRIALAVAAAMLAGAGTARAGVVIDVAANSDWIGDNITNGNWVGPAFTPGADGMLVVTLAGEGGQALTSFKYDGVDLIKAAAGAGGAFAYVYYLPNPAAGGGTFSWTTGLTNTRYQISAIYATGVGELEAFASNASGGVQTLTAGPIAASAGALVVGAGGHTAGAFSNGGIYTSGTPAAGQTVFPWPQPTSRGSGAGAAYLLSATGGSYTTQWNRTGAENEAVAIASFAAAIPFVGVDWTGDASGDIALAGNYGAVPTSTDALRFFNGPFTSLPSSNSVAGLTAGGLVFDADDELLMPVTISSSNGIVLGAQGITQKAQQDVILSLPIALSASQTWKNTSASQLIVSGAVSTGANALTVKDHVLLSGSLNVQAGGTVNLPTAALLYTGIDITGPGGIVNFTDAGFFAIPNLTVSANGGVTTTAGDAGMMIDPGGGLTIGPAVTELTLGGSGNVSLNTGIGSRSLNKVGAGTLTLGFENLLGSAPGNVVTVAAGTLNLNGWLQNFNDLDIVDGTLTTGATSLNNVNVAGNFSIGNGTLTMNAASRLVLGGSFASNSTVARTFASRIDLNTAGNHTFHVADGAGDPDLTISGIIADGAGGAAALVKTGAGRLHLTGVNAYTGGTWIKEGALSIGAANNLAPGTVQIGDTGGAADATFRGGWGGFQTVANSFVVNAGSTGKANFVFNQGNEGTTFSGAFTLDKDLVLTATTGRDVINFTGAFSGTGGLVIKGDVNLSSMAVPVYLGNAANGYTGKTSVLGGGLVLPKNTTVSDAAGVLGRPATADAREILLGDTSGSANVVLMVNDGRLTFDVSRPIRVQAGSTGEVAFAQAGNAGAWTFNGDLTLERDLTFREISFYSGGDFINGRILSSGAGGDLILYGAGNNVLSYTNVFAPENVNTRANAGAVRWQPGGAAGMEFTDGSSAAFGTGDIYLNGGSFEYYATHTGTTDVGIALTNAVHATGKAGGLYGWQDNNGGKANITFSGPIDLAGVLGVGSRTANPVGGGSAVRYSGTVTINQAAPGLRMIAASSISGINSRMTGDIVDGNGTRNPLVISSEGYTSEYYSTNNGLFTIEGANNTYAGGTIIDWSGYTHSGANNGITEVAAFSTLGTGDVTVMPGGRLRLNAEANLGANATLTVRSGKLALGVVALGTDSPTLAGVVGGSSAGVLGIDTLYLGFMGAGDLDMSAVGNGTMLLGSATTGTYAAETLGAGAGNTYRLGGGGSGAWVGTGKSNAGNVLTIANGVLTGDNSVKVGDTRIGGNGTVVLEGANDFGGALEITGYAIAGNAQQVYLSAGGSLLRGFAQTVAGQSPFGAVAGDVTMHGSTLELAGVSGGAVVQKHALGFDGLARVNVDATASNYPTTLAFDSLTRSTTYGRSVLAIRGVRGSLGVNEQIFVSNAPALRNGDTMVDPWFVHGAMTNSSANCDFLTYGEYYGFQRAIPTKTSLLAGTDATDIVSLAANEALPDTTPTIDVWALDLNAAKLTRTGTGSVTINVGSGGVIMGVDTAVDVGIVLNFGEKEGVVTGTSWRMKGNIAGSGGVTFAGGLSGGTGQTWMSLYNTAARNTFTGDITVLQGHLMCRFDDATGGDSLGDVNNDLFVNGGRLAREAAGNQLAATRTITIGPLGMMLDGDGDYTVYGQITGPGRLSIDNRTVTLDNANSTLNDYQGGTILYGGNLVVNANSSLGSGDVQIQPGRTLTLKGNANVASNANIKVDGTINLQSLAPAIGSIEGRGAIVLGASGVNTTVTIGGDNSSSTYFGTIGQTGGTGNLAKAGTGALTLYGASTYTGTTAVTDGTLLAKSAAALPGYGAAGKVSVADGATLAVTADAGAWNAAAIGGLLQNASFAAGSNLGIEVAGATPVGCAQDLGAVQAAKGLVKLGDGPLALTVANNYTGPTHVAAGTLQFTAAAATSGATVDAGATLDLARAGNASVLSAGTAVANNGLLAVSTAGQQLGALSGTGSTNVTAAASLTADSIVQDTLTIGAGGSVTIREVPVAVGGAAGTNAVPEPGTCVLIGVGLLSLLLWFRHRHGR